MRLLAILDLIFKGLNCRRPGLNFAAPQSEPWPKLHRVQSGTADKIIKFILTNNRYIIITCFKLTFLLKMAEWMKFKRDSEPCSSSEIVSGVWGRDKKGYRANRQPFFSYPCNAIHECGKITSHFRQFKH